MPKSLSVLSVPGLAHWASYLVNDDASGLEPAEAEAADAWFREIMDEHPLASMVCVVGCGEDYVGRLNGEQTVLTDYTIHVHTPEEHSLTVESRHLQTILVALHKTAEQYDQAADNALARHDASGEARVRMVELRAQFRLRAAEARAAAVALRAALPMSKG
jgi:hypothetical protein